MSFDFGYPNLSADKRGWGPGWPNCQSDRMVPIRYPSFSPSAQIRAEVHDLLILLCQETEKRGYKLDGPVLDDWAYVCRPTKRPDGTYTDVPSNHSWGLAVDLNSTRNVYGGGHDMPLGIAQLWRDYGWRWLGPPINDWAHFDFCGTPKDAEQMTAKARRELGGNDMTDVQLAKLAEALHTGRMHTAAVEDFLDGKTFADLDKIDDPERRRMLRAFLKAAKLPTS